MELSFQIAVGAGVTTLSIVLAHFFYVALYAPEKMNLGLALPADRRQTWGSRVYMGLVIISWSTFAFSGAYGLLFWLLPGDGAVLLSLLVAFSSLGLLAYIEESAYTARALRRSTLILRELEELIQYANIPNKATIERYKEKAKSAETPAEREAQAELAWLATLLADRENRLCDNAVNQASREAEERAQQQQKAEKKAQEAIAKQVREKQFKQMFDKNAEALATTKTLDTLGQGAEMLLEPSIVKQKWQPLLDFAERLRRLGPDGPIQSLLQAVAGTQPRDGATFELRYDGNERDGHYDALAIVAGNQGTIADGLVFESSFDGLIAAYFLRVALPGRLAWGHGFYDRDQRLVANLEQAIDILERDCISPDAPELRNFTIPAGFRIQRSDGSLTLSCLAYRPGKGFYDIAVSIAGGNASASKETELFQWGQGVFY